MLIALSEQVFQVFAYACSCNLMDTICFYWLWVFFTLWIMLKYFLDVGNRLLFFKPILLIQTLVQFDLRLWSYYVLVEMLEGSEAILFDFEP